MNDLRKTARISTDLKLLSCDAGNGMDACVMNMSSCGMFIKTNRPLPVDAVFSFTLQLPDDPEVMLIEGRVVWTKFVSNASPAGMGIQFANILPDHQNKIADFVEQLSNQKKDA
jgi:uncharacterized protein (TIGR02266 family)